MIWVQKMGYIRITCCAYLVGAGVPVHELEAELGAQTQRLQVDLLGAVDVE